MTFVLLAFVLATTLAGGCSSGVGASGAIVGVSSTVAVRGSYSPVALDRIERISLENGRIVLHGSSASVTVDPPVGADPSKPDSHWALATERDNGETRVLTFTHEIALNDFTIELPRSGAPIRFGGFTGRDGRDVLVLAWGEQSRSYKAELVITPIVPSPTSP